MTEKPASCDDEQGEDHCMLAPTVEVTEILEIEGVPLLAVRASERNRVRSPLSHLMEVETSRTTTPPGITKSFVELRSSSISPDPDGPGLHADKRISAAISYPNPITETAFSAACGFLSFCSEKSREEEGGGQMTAISLLPVRVLGVVLVGKVISGI
nr:hypothetical protein Iba_chr04eCG8060 [Ipomoea batatas]